MTEAESKKLDRWAESAGISKAEYVRQKVFGKEPQPIPEPVFWNHMAELYSIHDQTHNIPLRKQIRQLILDIQAEATQPKEVSADGDHQPVAH